MFLKQAMLANRIKTLSLGIFLTMLIGLLAACGDATATTALGLVNATSAPATTTAATTAPATTTAPLATTVAAQTTAAPVTTAAQTTAAPATTQAVTTAAPVTTAPTVKIVPIFTTARPTTAAPVATAKSLDQSIRKTNWVEVFRNDQNFSYEGSVPPFNQPYLQIRTTGGKGPGGFPNLDKIAYADMDGDGVEEAAIDLLSGGTAGSLAFIVFRQAKPRPQLVTYEEGYKLWLETVNGKLNVNQPIYAGWEPNCCPNGLRTTTYVLQGNKLASIAERKEGYPEAQPGTVEYFYLMISTGKFEAAYEYLAPAYKKDNPFDKWRAGFATTREVIAEAAVVPNQPNTVKVNITATDSTNGGGTTTKKFVGTWKLQWSSQDDRWLMSDPVIKPA